MSLQTNITDLATRVATECKALRVLINGNAADLSSLTTTAKGSLLQAVNELQAEIASAGAINDTGTSTTSAWSSSHTQSQINAAVTQAKSDLVNGAPTALDTLNELAAALADNDSEVAAITTSLSNNATAVSNLSTAVGDTGANFVTTFEAGLT